MDASETINSEAVDVRLLVFGGTDEVVGIGGCRQDAQSLCDCSFGFAEMGSMLIKELKHFFGVSLGTSQAFGCHSESTQFCGSPIGLRHLGE